MPNTYFQFKQFKIEQDKCAMKVCTDSCLFGAWVTIEPFVRSVLDIGTGTGLLSLMMAQRADVQIDAMEIDKNAFEQAAENIAASPWKDRIILHHGDIRNYNPGKKYDLIISNPPFYETDQKSLNREEKIAKHSMHLSLQELLLAVNNLLAETGKFCILLPYSRKDEFQQATREHHFYPEQSLCIRQTTEHSFFRFACMLSKENVENEKCQETAIKDHIGKYTEEFTSLLKPYYLYL